MTLKNSLSISLVLILSLACSCSGESEIINQTSSSENSLTFIETEATNHQSKWKDIIPYYITFDFEYVEVDVYALNVTIIPDEGSYILSHFSSDNFSGKFTLVADDKNITPLGDLIEIPPAGEIFEPFEQRDTKALVERTICAQHFKINTKEDFQFDGHVQFTIEPKCTFEKIPFTISQKDGIIMIKNKDSSSC